jgi:hypothetical protein
MLSSLPQTVTSEARHHGTNLFSQYVTLASHEASLRGDTAEVARNTGPGIRTKSSLLGLLPKRRLEWASVGEDLVGAVNNKLWESEQSNLAAVTATRKNNRYKLQQCPEHIEDERESDDSTNIEPSAIKVDKTPST